MRWFVIKVAIIGSRTISGIDISKHVPSNVDAIISGGAIGVDALSEEYADKNNIRKIIIKPDYNKYKKSAPIIRNKKIVDLADLVIAFWDGKSRGTKFTVDYARLKGKKVVLHKIINIWGILNGFFTVKNFGLLC